MSNVRHDKIKTAIEQKLDRAGHTLSADDLLTITIASRLNEISDHGFVEAMKGGKHE